MSEDINALFDPTLSSAILARDDFACVRCGKFCNYDYSIHHRILGNRKDRRASNLITLCGSGTTGCHAWVHSHSEVARSMGWIVSRHGRRDSTTSRPVWYGQRNAWYLLDDKLNCTPEAA